MSGIHRKVHRNQSKLRDGYRQRERRAKRAGKPMWLVERTRLDYPRLLETHPEAAAALKAEWGAYW